MKKKLFAGLLVGLFVIGVGGVAHAVSTITLDADSPGTGSLLQTTPLATSIGVITFTGQITTAADPDFIAAGASGDVFNIAHTAQGTFAQLDFSESNVSSISFIYGGNTGSINILAKDKFGATLDSFFQANTADGQPAGPVTLSGIGIHSLYWEDNPNFVSASFAALDNIRISTAVVPEPATVVLMGLGLVGLGYAGRRKLVS